MNRNYHLVSDALVQKKISEEYQFTDPIGFNDQLVPTEIKDQKMLCVASEPLIDFCIYVPSNVKTEKEFRFHPKADVYTDKILWTKLNYVPNKNTRKVFPNGYKCFRSDLRYEWNDIKQSIVLTDIKNYEVLSCDVKTVVRLSMPVEKSRFDIIMYDITIKSNSKYFISKELKFKAYEFFKDSTDYLIPSSVLASDVRNLD